MPLRPSTTYTAVIFCDDQEWMVWEDADFGEGWFQTIMDIMKVWREVRHDPRYAYVRYDSAYKIVADNIIR